MSKKFSYLSSIGKVFLFYIALMVIQTVEGANILSKYKSGYNVDKVCFWYQRNRISYRINCMIVEVIDEGLLNYLYNFSS